MTGAEAYDWAWVLFMVNVDIWAFLFLGALFAEARKRMEEERGR